MPLHVTLSKLLFTSHCICFYYIMICPVSPPYTIGVVSFTWSWCTGCWLWTGHYFTYFVSCVVCWPDNNLLHISSTSAIGVNLFAWSQCIGCCWLWTGHCSSYLFPGYMFPTLFANQMLICFMSAAHVSLVLSPLNLQCVSWLWTGHCSGFIVSSTVC